MSGCRSCSGHSREPGLKVPNKAEKLEKGERSDNPRYPHLFVGSQAVFTDGCVQMIVTVVSDDCNETCDCFTLKPQQILKGSRDGCSPGESFEVSQEVGSNCWKLRALI